MPSKLSVSVVHCSGEDENFPAAELTQHTPHTKGWQSPKFAEFPQEVGLRLEGECVVQQVQFLSHESKIATKIEVFVSEPDAQNPHQFPPYEATQWRRLGYLSLSSNQHSEYLARELKTVHVSAVAVYIRLLFHKCHVNSYNFFNQVGLIAINVMGDVRQRYEQPAQLMPYELQARAHVPHDGPEVALKDMKPPTVSADEYSDVRYDLQFDPQTMKKLRELSVMKQRAVAEEDYDSAKRLKDQIAALKQVGSRLLQLENQKKHAVANEEYDLAKALKADIDQLRVQAMGHGRPSLSGGGQRAPPPPLAHLPPMGAAPQFPVSNFAQAAHGGTPAIGGAPLPPLTAHNHSPESSPSTAGGDAQQAVRHIPQPPGHGLDARPLRPPPPEPPQRAPVNLDDRPAVSRALAQNQPPIDGSASDAGASPSAPPTYRRNVEDMLNDPDPFNTGQGQGGSGGGGSVGDAFDVQSQPDWARDLYDRVVALRQEAQHVAPLPEAKARDHGEYATVFGEFGLRCLFAKDWHARDAAIRAISGKFAAGGGDPAPFPSDRRHQIALLLRYLTLKNHGFNDPIAGVFTSCAEALRILLSCDLPSSAGAPLQSVAAALVPKAAEVAPRTREQATELLLLLATCPVVGPERIATVAMHEPESVKKKEKEAHARRPLHARATLVLLLLDKFGINRQGVRTGLTADSVMTRIAMPGLQSSHDEVRRVAVKICGALHRLGAGKVVQQHTKMLKPVLKKAIDEECGDGGGHLNAEHELMNSSVSVDGDDEVKRQMRAARTAAQQRVSPTKSAAVRQGYGSPAVHPPAATVISPRTAAAAQQQQQGQEEVDDTVCQFCGLRDPRFNEQVLDLHYLHSCPMLFQCQYCEQVIEIMMLNEHWLQECEKRPQNLPEHPPEQCVLCKAKLPLSAAGTDAESSLEERYEQHILRDGCPMNPRGRGQHPNAPEFRTQPQTPAQPGK